MRKPSRTTVLFTISGLLIVSLAVLVAYQAVAIHQMQNGDINRDGKVNALDLSKLASHFQHGTN